MTLDEFNEYGLCPEDNCDCGSNHMPEYSAEEMEDLERAEVAASEPMPADQCRRCSGHGWALGRSGPGSLDHCTCSAGVALGTVALHRELAKARSAA